MQISTDGLIIMEQNVGENDRLITILTRSDGIIRAFVRGAKNSKSRSLSSTQLLSYSDFVIYKGKNKYIINEAESKEVFFNLRKDIEKLALAQYFCELALALVPDNGEAGDFLRLILNSLYYTANNKLPNSQIKAIFEMRIMSLAGYMPNLIYCTKCGIYETDVMYFLPVSGVLCCSKCYNKNDYGIMLDRSTVTALRHIVFADFNKLFSFKIPQENLRTLSNTTEKYVINKLERNFKTLDFYHQMQIEI